MTKKLYELISNTIGGKVTIMGKELILERITIGKLIELENEGQDIQSLMTDFNSKPASISTKLGWLLLNADAKSEFNNNYKTFVDCLEMTDLEALGNAVIDAVNNSKPSENKEKNETGATE